MKSAQRDVWEVLRERAGSALNWPPSWDWLHGAIRPWITDVTGDVAALAVELSAIVTYSVHGGNSRETCPVNISPALMQ
jgi:hypothetical protein